MHGAFEKIPNCILRLLIERVVSYGVTLTRASDSWNDFGSLKHEVDDMRAVGMETVANLIYTVSPRHHDDYYAQKAREAAAIKPYRICFKDVGGLLTPERARTLVPIIQKNVGAVPLEFHAHCRRRALDWWRRPGRGLVQASRLLFQGRRPAIGSAGSRTPEWFAGLSTREASRRPSSGFLAAGRML